MGDGWGDPREHGAGSEAPLCHQILFRVPEVTGYNLELGVKSSSNMSPEQKTLNRTTTREATATTVVAESTG